jgi:predicted nucleic-acid-binding protein
MKGLDTNVVLRLVVDDDPEQSAAASAFLASLPDGEKAVVDVIVLVEFVWVLKRVFGFERARLTSALVKILRHPKIHVPDRDLVLEAAYDAYENGGDFADILIALRNRAAGCSTTVTFDRDAVNRSGFSLLSTAKP